MLPVESTVAKALFWQFGRLAWEIGGRRHTANDFEDVVEELTIELRLAAHEKIEVMEYGLKNLGDQKQRERIFQKKTTKRNIFQLTGKTLNGKLNQVTVEHAEN